MTRRPNPDQDYEPLLHRLYEWVYAKPKRVLASWMAIVGSALVALSFVIWLVAIWSPAEPYGNRLGNTGALFFFFGAAVGGGGFGWRATK